jgi:hypothetical protein
MSLLITLSAFVAGAFCMLLWQVLSTNNDEE